MNSICAKKLQNLCNSEEFGYIFSTLKSLCEVLAIQYELGARTRLAYKNNDINALKRLLTEYKKAIM